MIPGSNSLSDVSVSAIPISLITGAEVLIVLILTITPHVLLMMFLLLHLFILYSVLI